MSHGGLNILGKKSWNVWNRDNRERVARDEAKAAEEDSAKRRRAEAAEQEARLNLLRARAHRPENEDSFAAPADGNLIDAKTGHINLFAEAKTSTTNEEAEAEKKAKKDEEERRLGIVKYLDEGTHKKAWYERSGTAETDEGGVGGGADGGGRRFPLTAEARKALDEKRKASADPAAHVAAALAGTPRTPAPASRTRAPVKPAYDSIAALRAEREARERGERARAENLLNPQTRR